MFFPLSKKSPWERLHIQPLPDTLKTPWVPPPLKTTLVTDDSTTEVRAGEGMSPDSPGHSSKIKTPGARVPCAITFQSKR